MLPKIIRRNISYHKNSYNNIPPGIWDLTKRKIYKIPNHPIKILIDEVNDFFTTQKVSDIVIPNEKWKIFTDFSPLVSTHDCFDELFIPPDHISRQPTDTFYSDRDHCLRPHTSVHQIPLMK